MVTYEGLKALGVDLRPKYIRALVRRGKFPKPATGGRNPKLGPFQWRESDIRTYLKSKTR
ncbi:MAG: hypothetical protein WDN31_15515 [Hyphomicrobium sp.]